MSVVTLKSGVWDGYYVQRRKRHRQQMRLEFADGLMRGSGQDSIGPFTIDGEFRIADGETRLGWIKTYDQGHSVLYVGTLEDSVIQGTWDIHASGDRFALEFVDDANSNHE